MKRSGSRFVPELYADALYLDRPEAGRQLAAAIREAAIQADLVLAIPRGGVAVAAPVAAELGLPLDVLVALKIGAPPQPELAIGAVTRFGAVWNQDVIDSLQLNATEVQRALEQAEQDLREREARFRRTRPPKRVEGLRVFLIDDGWATGATAAAAIRALNEAGAARVIAATPVAAVQAVMRVEEAGARALVLATPAEFQAVGSHYRQFFPVTTDVCIDLLNANSQSQITNSSCVQSGS